MTDEIERPPRAADAGGFIFARFASGGLRIPARFQRT
jgi:hypothetical protein